MNKLALLPLLASLSVVYTFAVFSDVEPSAGNTFAAARWQSYADCLAINATDAKLTGNGRTLHNIVLMNVCDSPIVLDKFAGAWGDGALLHLQLAGGYGTEWSGLAASNDVVDFENVVLPNPDKLHLSLDFESDVSGRLFSLRFLMGDGSFREVSFAP